MPNEPQVAELVQFIRTTNLAVAWKEFEKLYKKPADFAIVYALFQKTAAKSYARQHPHPKPTPSSPNNPTSR